jgi:hypothetical protein
MVLVTFVALVPAAQAAGFDPNQIIFPVDGETSYSDTFDDCRGTDCSRRHNATDLMAAKGLPVLAAAAGTVDWIGSTCCILSISHGDGWGTQYIHLNNDTKYADGSYSDDGLGWGIAPGIQVGSYVEAGQVIGWVGDSGNAEHVGSHLHFEIWQGETRINPYPYLLAAEARGTQTSFTGIFRDDDYSVHEPDIDTIYLLGITRGCTVNFDYCPERDITRGEMAAFIARTLGLTTTTGLPAYTDVEDHYFREEIDKIQTAGIGFGCTATEFCPDRPLERDEMAELLVRSFGFVNPGESDYFGDDQGNSFETSINTLAFVGVTIGCTETEFCPDRLLTRAEMATFFVRALSK